MSNQRPFPLELLQKPSSEKLTYFKGITVPHKNLKEVLNVLKTNILEPADTSLFLVFGSTGIGKTTLRLRLEKLILEEFLEELRQNPGLIAVAGVEVNSPAQGKFNQSDYYIRVLESLNEVLISYKVDYAISDDRRGGGAGGREQGEQSLSRSREAERNMGIKPRPSRAFSIGRSTRSV
ncbi:MAG TPA: hypothetical protein V6D25_07820, partial [Leptolyngbyaceae cyanobacterium]